MAPLSKEVSHKHHLSLHSLIAMSTLMAPTHHHTAQIQAGGGLADTNTPKNTVPYITHAVQAHLARVYESLRGADKLLSRSALEDFLKDIQRQDIPLPEAVSHFDYKDWLAFVWLNGGFEAVRPLDKKTKDWSRPISNYYISSSHNTYLSGNQLLSKSTTDAYKNVSHTLHLLSVS